MNIQELKDALSNTSAISLGKSKQPSVVALKTRLMDATNWCPEDYSIATRIFIVMNDVTEVPKCVCGEHTVPNKLNNRLGFSKYCSIPCNQKYSRLSKEATSKLADYDWMYEHRITKKLSKESIAELLDVSTQAINTSITNLVIPDVNYTESNPEVKEMLRNSNHLASLYDEGHTWKKVAEIIGSSEAVVYAAATKYGIVSRAPNSYPRAFVKTSVGENEVADFIRSNYDGEILRSVRGYAPNDGQLDIYLPEKNFAIEFNGIYHHQYNPDGKTYGLRKDETYHVGKTDECMKHGINLIHVFSDQWEFNKEIIKSMILARLGLVPNKIYTRKCSVVHPTLDQKRVFLIDNHLSGNDKTTISYGLQYDDKLVAMMTFAKPRFSTKYDWELVRYCVAKNSNVVGGFSKLLSEFKKQHTGSIISYADRTISNGDVYHKNGFIEISKNSPTGWGLNFRDGFRFRRTQLMKKNLVKEFGVTVEMSEKALRNVVGIPTIFDCGTLTFVIQ